MKFSILLGLLISIFFCGFTNPMEDNMKEGTVLKSPWSSYPISLQYVTDTVHKNDGIVKNGKK